MDLIDMYFDQIEDAKQRRVPFIIPVGTIEYHAHHVSSGTDTMVVTGCLRELGKEKEIVVLPPIWYGVASYAVGGPETGTIHVDEDTHTQYVYCILKSLGLGRREKHLSHSPPPDGSRGVDAHDDLLPQGGEESHDGVYGGDERSGLVGEQRLSGLL